MRPSLPFLGAAHPSLALPHLSLSLEPGPRFFFAGKNLFGQRSLRMYVHWPRNLVVGSSLASLPRAAKKRAEPIFNSCRDCRDCRAPNRTPFAAVGEAPTSVPHDVALVPASLARAPNKTGRRH